ncbi:hypothetical protein [Tateyamaria pelophila]|uniref:hypothetical protein n=1 Tax=Tateyamaria pelophila TaxID=328415 RepID=UPI001CC1AB4A|nr:hypothetical protein [Tateyamaria pelophila]
MKHILRSNQRHDIYRKYHVQDSEIRDLLGECGVRYGDYRFIRYVDGKTEMYNIKEDWWQKYDLGNSHPDYSLVNEKHLECCKAHGLHFSV